MPSVFRRGSQWLVWLGLGSCYLYDDTNGSCSDVKPLASLTDRPHEFLATTEDDQIPQRLHERLVIPFRGRS